MSDQERVVRVRLQEDLVRRMDALLQRRVGGMETRNEFVEEALRMLVVEYEYDDDREEAKPSKSKRASPPKEDRPELVLMQESDTPPLFVDGDLSFTELVPPSKPVLMDEGIAQVDDMPLFGLHNRDYPTIWAGFQIAGLTEKSFQPADEIFKIITKRSWEIAEHLTTRRSPPDFKLTSLFPQNRDKRQAAEGRFRAFALGRYGSTEEGVAADGPLFSWRICQLDLVDNEVVIGITPEGWTLIENLRGLSLNLPHPETIADAFVAHLRSFSPEDWWGFRTVVMVAAEGATRQTMIDKFASEKTGEWTDAKISTNAQGYVARCREWGLLEPKMTDGEYRLTPYGEKTAEESMEENR